MSVTPLPSAMDVAPHPMGVTSPGSVTPAPMDVSFFPPPPPPSAVHGGMKKIYFHCDSASLNVRSRQTKTLDVHFLFYYLQECATYIS